MNNQFNAVSLPTGQKQHEPEMGKPISKFELSQLGIDLASLKIVETLEEISKYPPNIVIAQCLKNISFVQNKSKLQHIKKKRKYVMGLGTYQQLHYDFRTNAKILKPSIRFSNIYRPYKGQDLNNKIILIWRTGGIGDLLFIQPNLKYIKEKWPESIIWFACGPQYQPMVEDWDCVDRLLDLPFDFGYLIDSDYHCIFEGIIERTKVAETTNAYELFTTWMGLNIPVERRIPEQDIKVDMEEKALKVLEEWDIDSDDFIVMQIKASSPIRTPSYNMWKKLTEALVEKGHKIVITDGKHNNDYIETFRGKLDEETRKSVFNFSLHSESLDSTIALSSLSKLVVGTDSALLHLATAVNVPCFGIYGPFTGDIRLSTYPQADWINCKTKDINCAPCFVHGNNPCKNSVDGFSLCYENIDIDECMEKIDRLLED